MFVLFLIVFSFFYHYQFFLSFFFVVLFFNNDKAFAFKLCDSFWYLVAACLSSYHHWDALELVLHFLCC